MFTLKIKDLISVGRGEMKCMASGPSSSPENSNPAYDDFLKKAKEGKGEVFLKNAKSEERKAILEKINALPATTDAKKLAWREAMKNEINRLNASVAPVAPMAPVELAPPPIIAANPATEEKQQQENDDVKDAQEKAKDIIIENTKPQIEATKDDVGPLRVVSMTEQATALAKILGITDKEASKSIVSDLKDTNISSLLMLATDPSKKAAIGEFIKNYNERLNPTQPDKQGSFNEHAELKKLGYTPNGSIWFGGESQKVLKFLELSQQKIGGDNLYITSEYARAGLATTIALSDKTLNEKLTPENLVGYLGNIPNSRYRKVDVINMLESMKNSPDFARNIARVAGMPSITNTIELVEKFKEYPEYKAQFFDAINANGANEIIGLKAFIEGRAADKAQEQADKISKTLTDKANEAKDKAEKMLDKTSDPTEKAKIEAVIAEYNRRGPTWFTGEIQKVAEGAFVNIGKGASALGAGMSFETFIQGLTVSLGAGVGDGSKLIAGAIVHYDVANGQIGQTENMNIEGLVGVGTSVFPTFVPFVDGGIKGTDKIKSFGGARGDVGSIGINAQLSSIGGLVSFSSMNERQSEIAQGYTKMTEAVRQLSALTSTEVTPDKFATIVKEIGLTASSADIQDWVEKIQSLYARNPGSDKLTPEARTILLMGLVKSEVEKSGIQEANNDVDGRSYKGWAVGVGHVLGVTFPVAGIAFSEGKMNYTYPKNTTQTLTTSIPAKPVEDIKLGFDTLYTIDTDKKTITFDKGEIPKTVTISGDLGTYDVKTGILTLKVAPTDIVMQPKLSSDKYAQLESVTVLKKTQSQKDAEEVRDINIGFSTKLATAVYAMNRNPEYKTYNAALVDISNKDYDGAYTKLMSFSKQVGNGASLVKEMLQVLNKDGKLSENKQRLATINTYTYGDKMVKNAKNVNKAEYLEARKDTIRAEKNIAGARWNDANEAIFTNEKNHTPAQLSSFAELQGQALSVTVFATPSRATARIDKYDGSITVGNKIITEVNPAQKEGIISDHKGTINAQVNALKAFVEAGGKKSDIITVSAYENMLKTGDIPAEWKSLGLDFNRKPVFFEARAMAAGNVCMNKTEGIGYPSFSYINMGAGATIVRQGVTPPTSVDGNDIVGASADATERITGVGISLADAPKEKDTPPPKKPDAPTVPDSPTTPPPTPPPVITPPVEPPITPPVVPPVTPPVTPPPVAPTLPTSPTTPPPTPPPTITVPTESF